MIRPNASWLSEVFGSRSQSADSQLTREDVINGYRWILGRLPESEAVVQQHMLLGSIEGLRGALLRSAEFTLNNKVLRFDEKWVLAPVYAKRLEMWLDLHDQFVSFGCIHDNYEPIETRFIADNMPQGGVALDIGANIGWHTLGLALAVGEAGHVTAFEPRMPTVEYLRRTVERNSLTNRVSVQSVGLWDSETTLSLGWASDTVNPGRSFVTASVTGLTTQSITVSTLDSLVHGHVDFIKIDVEGAEPKVFQGGRNLVAKSRPVILSELNPSQLHEVSNTSPDDYVGQMKRLGYECRLLEEGYVGVEVTGFPDFISRDLVNVVFLPSGRSVKW